MAKKLLTGFVILVVFAAALTACHAYAEENASILFMEGEVKVKAPDTDQWQDAEVGMALSKGDSVKTELGSWVEIGIGEGLKNIVRLKEATLAEITDLGPVDLGLLKGELRSFVERLEKESTFQIRTPTAVCGARGTGWDTNTDGKKVIVDAYEEEVFFRPISESGELLEESIIAAGKRTVLEDPAIPIVIKDLPPYRIKEWGEWKDSLLERINIRHKGIGVAADPRFRKPRREYEMALMHIKKGDDKFRHGIAAAKKSYEHAEDYLLKAAFLYKQLGEEYDVDVNKEVDACEDLYRKVHVKIGKVKRKLLRRR